MTRCYELVNTDGLVKFRVTRYDEEMDSALLTFPNGAPIWKPRSAHPYRPVTDAGFDAFQLGGYCNSSSVLEFADGTLTTQFAGFPQGIYQGAFIMEKFIGAGQPGENYRCWNLAHNLLSRGMSSETCAQYMWAGNRMNFRFIPCKNIRF